MPRQARHYGEYQHIIVRGIGKQILFEEDADRQKYLFFLRKYKAETGITVLAYCLMENHVHLLIRDISAAVPVLMKKLGVCYSQYYNRKYERTGHLFQDRYKNEIIKDDANLLTVFRYILNNPYKAGICRAEEYPWSSCREYGKKNGITDTVMLSEMIGDVKAFHDFLRQQNDAECMEADSKKKDDKWALEALKTTLGVTSGSELQKYERKARDEALALLRKKGLSIRQLERLTGINRGVIQNVKADIENRPR